MFKMRQGVLNLRYLKNQIVKQPQMTLKNDLNKFNILQFIKTEDWLVRGLDLKPWNLVPRTYPPWVNKNIRDVFSPETVSKGLNRTDLDIRDVKSELQSLTKITYNNFGLCNFLLSSVEQWR